ncbi:MAG: hypothetical protein A2V93_08305 [Ignavibacteria bacterium RBG_16_34_14]|nr:MAG: hypothetical protein A2V93_08305 [Ignavibacteria bacterium RBG_16_34_14]
MFEPIKIIDIDISPFKGITDDLRGLGKYQKLKAFIRWDNISIGYINVPIIKGSVSKELIAGSIMKEHSKKLSLINSMKKHELTSEKNNTLIAEKKLPLVTVVVCTKNRVENLELCLSSLLNLKYPNTELIVVDNAPSDDSTKNFVENFASKIKYICEPKPGLSWARNKAIKESNGEIIAFTDDDVIVDKLWVNEITTVFMEEPDTMAVTGLVIPYELETYSQELFETYGGFSRGFERKCYKWALSNKEKASKYFGGTGKCGTGANMAFRKKIFNEIGFFNPILGVGTPTNGGEDLEFFFRIIKAGFSLVYEPNAVVRHRHRKSYNELKNQITNNGIGLYSYITHAFITYKNDRYQFFYLAVWWFFYWDIKRLFLSFKRPQLFPRDLIVAELKGSFLGLNRYLKSKKIASCLANVNKSFFTNNVALAKEKQ